MGLRLLPRTLHYWGEIDEGWLPICSNIPHPGGGRRARIDYWCLCTFFLRRDGYHASWQFNRL